MATQTKIAGTGTDSNDETASFSFPTILCTATWSDPGNVTANDGNLATTSPASSANAATRGSNYLKATDFGFTIPDGSVINGISVEVELSTGDAVNNYIGDAQVIKGGTLVAYRPTMITDGFGDNPWQSQTIGSSSELWTETWTATDINSSSFGFGIMAVRGSGGSPAMSVDHITITVDYTPPSGSSRMMMGIGS